MEDVDALRRPYRGHFKPLLGRLSVKRDGSAQHLQINITVRSMAAAMARQYCSCAHHLEIWKYGSRDGDNAVNTRCSTG